MIHRDESKFDCIRGKQRRSNYPFEGAIDTRDNEKRQIIKNDFAELKRYFGSKSSNSIWH